MFLCFLQIGTSIVYIVVIEMKTLYKLNICLLIYFSGTAFGIIWEDLSPLQKKIHALLYNIACEEQQLTKNCFTVALEITTIQDEENKTYVFLLRSNENEISFFSGGSGIEATRSRVHENLYGYVEEDCIAPNGRNKGNVQFKKGLIDSEFACITFLENNKSNIINLIKKEIEEQTITKISLHGYTTRDTCLACLSHLISYCNNANIGQSQVESKNYRIENIKESIATFWKELKTQLNFSEPINFFISSRVLVAESSIAVKSIVEKQISNPSPMKMLILRKNFDMLFQDELIKPFYSLEDIPGYEFQDAYSCNEKVFEIWQTKFSDFIKKQDDDLDENFKIFLKETKLTKELLSFPEYREIKNITHIFETQ